MSKQRQALESVWSIRADSRFVTNRIRCYPRPWPNHGHSPPVCARRARRVLSSLAREGKYTPSARAADPGPAGPDPVSALVVGRRAGHGGGLAGRRAGRVDCLDAVSCLRGWPTAALGSGPGVARRRAQ